MSDLIRREDAREAIEKLMEIHFDRQVVLAKARDAIVSLPSAEAEDRHYIKIYADDEPSVKAEKLYQICGETQNREVAEWLKEYFPSAEPKTGEWVWSDEDASWMCGACCCVFEEIDWKPNYNFCPNCGARMNGGEEE